MVVLFIWQKFLMFYKFCHKFRNTQTTYLFVPVKYSMAIWTKGRDGVGCFFLIHIICFSKTFSYWRQELRHNLPPTEIRIQIWNQDLIYFLLYFERTGWTDGRTIKEIVNHVINKSFTWQNGKSKMCSFNTYLSTTTTKSLEEDEDERRKK